MMDLLNRGWTWKHEGGRLAIENPHGVRFWVHLGRGIRFQRQTT